MGLIEINGWLKSQQPLHLIAACLKEKMLPTGTALQLATSEGAF
jgi:hypothetical protein